MSFFLARCTSIINSNALRYGQKANNKAPFFCYLVQLIFCSETYFPYLGTYSKVCMRVNGIGIIFHSSMGNGGGLGVECSPTGTKVPVLIPGID